jgi:uncharacterized protein
MTTTLPSYDELAEALEQTTLKMHASQVHGIIAGIICGNTNTSTAWEELVTGSDIPEATHLLLQQLYNHTHNQLTEFLFELQLLLPSDDDALVQRAEGLTVWTQGFLTGLKLAQVQIEDRPASEVTEVINDMLEIAKMNYEEVVASEEDEAAFVELVEYVRMAAILIYQDLHDATSETKATQNHLH